MALETKLPYFLFGHSFGGLVAFEIVRELRRRATHQPLALLVAGRPAPSLGAVYPLNHLGDDDLLHELLHIDPEVQAPLSTPVVFREVLPSLRADLAVCDSYIYQDEPPLSIPIIGFAGRSDPVGTIERIYAWRNETVAPFVVHVFEGGHFFFRTAWPMFLAPLHSELHRLAS